VLVLLAFFVLLSGKVRCVHHSCIHNTHILICNTYTGRHNYKAARVDKIVAFRKGRHSQRPSPTHKLVRVDTEHTDIVEQTLILLTQAT